MMQNETCKKVCDTQLIGPASAKFINRRMEQHYALNWLVDGLPAGQQYEMPATGEVFFRKGFPLGTQLNEDDNYAASKSHLNNHYDIVVNYHAVGNGKYRVVGVLVHATSRKESRINEDNTAFCGDPDIGLSLDDSTKTPVTWTYSVYWMPSKVAWAVRWDNYLHVEDPKIHWFSLVNSAIIVVFLTGTVSAILVRALKKDFARYNRLDTFNLDDFSATDLGEDGVQEDSGWKLVHGDVFRPPPNPLLLSIFLGNGAQLFFMTGITIVFALLGFLSPSNRGSLGTAILILYTILGFVGGYVSARVYKTFEGQAWKRNIMLTPVLVPAAVFGTFFLLNLFMWARGSSGAVPFTTMLVLVSIWFVITVPLSFTGSWIGFKQAVSLARGGSFRILTYNQPFSAPVRTNQIPRQIPPAVSYLRPLPSMLLVGALPFGSIFVELFFIMNSIWFSRIYYMFGFLFLCYGLMIITCAAVTIMFVYYLLCAENHRWHWRAFNSAGAGSIFIFMFSIIYWIWRLRFSGFASMVLFVGYSMLISFLFFILAGKTYLSSSNPSRSRTLTCIGTIGFFSSFAFVRKIYSSIRVD